MINWFTARLPIEYRTPGRFWIMMMGHNSFLRIWHKVGIGRQREQVPSNADPKLKALIDAWPCCRTGYYTVDIAGVQLPGGRSWSERWGAIESATDYDNKTILELGCNQAILSTSLMKFCNAKQTIAVDIDKRALRTGNILADYYGVSPTFIRVDFDAQTAWEDMLTAYQPDIVTAMSVLNWVKDKDRFVAFLSRFDQLLYEGHRSVEVETDYLLKSGFAKVDIVESKPGRRAVLLATK